MISQDLNHIADTISVHVATGSIPDLRALATLARAVRDLADQARHMEAAAIRYIGPNLAEADERIVSLDAVRVSRRAPGARRPIDGGAA